MKNRNEKGQFARSIDTIEEGIMSYELNGQDSPDYFKIKNCNYENYLRVTGLEREKNRLEGCVTKMQELKQYITFLRSNNINIEDYDYTFGCRRDSDHVSIGILGCQAQANLEAAKIVIDWDSLGHREKLTLIIEKLTELIVTIDNRIAYLHSPAK